MSPNTICAACMHNNLTHAPLKLKGLAGSLFVSCCATILLNKKNLLWVFSLFLLAYRKKVKDSTEQTVKFTTKDLILEITSHTLLSSHVKAELGLPVQFRRRLRGVSVHARQVSGPRGPHLVRDLFEQNIVEGCVLRVG